MISFITKFRAVTQYLLREIPKKRFLCIAWGQPLPYVSKFNIIQSVL